jgi:hypothetical protein
MLLLCSVFIGLPATAWATSSTDPVGDFLATYPGPHNADLDVILVDVLFDGVNFNLHAIMNGAIGTTPGAIYVWGVDRGAGTVGFPTMAPGVIFDRVVVLNNNDTSALAGVTVTHSGNTIDAVVPLSLAAMASTGFTPENYTWNLWPRNPPAAAGNLAITDFAPDNSNIRVTFVPEPSSLVLLVLGVLGVAGFRRRHDSLTS